MTVPTGDINTNVRADLVNVIIDEVDNGPIVAAVDVPIQGVRTPVRPANSPHALAMLEHTKQITATITLEEASDAIRRFLLELATTGASAYEPSGSTVVPTHSLRLNDPADTAHTNDLFIPSVVFDNYRETYADGENPTQLKPSIDYTALVPGSGTHAGKLFEIGTTFTPA